VETDKRFAEYLLELSDSVTGRRIFEVLLRAAFQTIADKSQKVGLQRAESGTFGMNCTGRPCVTNKVITGGAALMLYQR
jgi:hypothetical protein